MTGKGCYSLCWQCVGVQMLVSKIVYIILKGICVYDNNFLFVIMYHGIQSTGPHANFYFVIHNGR